METTTVWTRQHESVLETLEQTGRYTAKREYIQMDLSEHAGLVLEVYDWLVVNGPDAAGRPADAEYPVWVSFTRDAAMLPGSGTVILELTLPRRLITSVNIEKWGAMLNYSYIPRDAQDARRHKKLLADLGVSDAKAYLSRFYPELKAEIRRSWTRLFDDSVILGSTAAYGNIWEVRKEWLTAVIR